MTLDAVCQPSSPSFQKLLDSLLDVVCVIDTGGVFVQVSKASEKLWKYTPDELIGKHYIDFIVEEDRQK